MEELFTKFKKNFPDHQYQRPKNLYYYLKGIPGVRPIGKSLRYGLTSWEKVYFGSIRDLLVSLLEASDEPINVEKLFESVVSHFPKTNVKSIASTMDSDSKNRFVRFSNRYYGLSGKKYSRKFFQSHNIYSPQENHSIFDEHLRHFHSFVEKHHRYPIYYSDKEEEVKLRNWIYKAQNGGVETTKKQKAILAATLKTYEEQLIPRSESERRFREHCVDYENFVKTNHRHPTSSDSQPLFQWYKRAVRAYGYGLDDYRRRCLTKLFESLKQLVF